MTIAKAAALNTAALANSKDCDQHEASPDGQHTRSKTQFSGLKSSPAIVAEKAGLNGEIADSSERVNISVNAKERSLWTKSKTGEGILRVFKSDQCLRKFETNKNMPRLATKEELVMEPSLKILKDLKETASPPSTLHRKQWEFVFIMEALKHNKVLGPSKRGFGFGVGNEPLVEYFASMGVHVMASDVPPDDSQAKAWGQNKKRTPLTMNPLGIANDAAMKQNVEVVYLNWNKLEQDPKYPQWKGSFDFVWSTCSVEHVGSIELGIKAMLSSLSLLKPGGIAVHTTEFNLGSLDETPTSGDTVLFRKRDIEQFRGEALNLGFEIDPVCYNAGTQFEDGYVDAPPYALPHLRLEISGYVATCFGVVVRRPLT